MECPPWVYITKITVWAGSLIDALQFETSNGTTSPKYGGHGGKPHIIDPHGKHICEVKGRSANQVNQICFGYGADLTKK
jgi:hypothetical protein